MRAARSAKVIVDAASFGSVEISNMSALNGILLFQAQPDGFQSAGRNTVKS
jgi:hypothetical protein